VESPEWRYGWADDAQWNEGTGGVDATGWTTPPAREHLRNTPGISPRITPGPAAAPEDRWSDLTSLHWGRPPTPGQPAPGSFAPGPTGIRPPTPPARNLPEQLPHQRAAALPGWVDDRWSSPPTTSSGFPATPPPRPELFADPAIRAPLELPAGSSGNLPAVRGSAGLPARQGYGQPVPSVRTVPGNALERIPRRRLAPTAASYRRRRDDEFADEPSYGIVAALTTAWYALPSVVFLLWALTASGSRQGGVGHQLGTSLPWLAAALSLSLVVAGLLRWAIVGWRALTLSFAAAVIGAGVATIAHSLTV
jgi:hypothetical protein